MTRRTTNALIEMVEEGILTWEIIARSALDYLSESEVEDMAHHNNLLLDEDDTEDED